jgi:Holliday junction resolvasome RuvABC ATP-dependent DNA helicase subunit
MKRKFEDNEKTNNISNKKVKLLETLEDLISYIENYNIGPNKKKLNKILPSLIKLHKLTGMTSVKKTIVGHILYFLMSYEKNKDMIHTVIEGPPGVGKTTLGYILGEIYANLDIIEQPKNKTNNLKFRIVKRSDLVAKYLGQTSHRTQEAINSVLGGVLFIDEAYSLGNNDVDDSYSKECLDTLNQNLSEKKNQFLCIIAGYKNALEKNFFAYNEGLRRRFPFTYTIEEYTPNELKNIFLGMLDDSWGIEGYKKKEDKEEEDINKDKLVLNIISNKSKKKDDKKESDEETNIINNKRNKIRYNKKTESDEKEIKVSDEKEIKETEDKEIKETDKKESDEKEIKDNDKKESDEKEIKEPDNKEKEKEIKEIKEKEKEIKEKDNLLIFFNDNKKYFPNFGGDIETLIFQSKIEHCKRVFFKDANEQKILTLDDIKNGLEVLKKNKKIVKVDNYKHLPMYL